MKEFIENIVCHLVDRPEEVGVREEDEEEAKVFHLTVGTGELGKVIGKEGRTARALRTIVTAAAAKMGMRAKLKIDE